MAKRHKLTTRKIYQFQCDTCDFATDSEAGVKMHNVPGHRFNDLSRPFSVTMHIADQPDRTYIVKAVDEWNARSAAQLARGYDPGAPRLHGQRVDYTVIEV